MTAYRDAKGIAHRGEGSIARGGSFRAVCSCGWEGPERKFRSTCPGDQQSHYFKVALEDA